MLERAIAAGESFLPQVGAQPAFGPLRDDARFTEVLRRVGVKP
jgi:hypothetical protein